MTRSGTRGFILLTVLAVAAIVGALALGFMAYAASDQHLQAAQSARDQAYYCCKSGVSYLASHPLTSLALQPDGTRLLSVGSRGRCNFTIDTNTSIVTCTGTVTDGAGRVLACRRVEIPPDNLELYHEVP